MQNMYKMTTPRKGGKQRNNPPETTFSPF